MTNDLIEGLKAEHVEPSLVCEVELTHFDKDQEEIILQLLLFYFLSNFKKEIIAAGSAIRKYLALLPMDQMWKVSELLDLDLCVELEIEVVKMVFRNYEVFPPNEIDSQPELAGRLLEMAKAYVNPRILLRDKYSAVASLAIEALFAMRSSLASEAFRLVAECPYRWFTEIVNDDLDDLSETWNKKNIEAADWLKSIKEGFLEK